MQILQGKDVDVLTPFPSTMIPKAAQWMHCYKTLVFGDEGPKTSEEIQAFLQAKGAAPNIISWGVVDKNNLTQSREFPAPLVGVIYFELFGPNNGYAHLASNRRAWGERIAQPGLMEQAAQIALESVFATMPALQRISLTTYASNKAAWHMAQRLGFHKDGYFKSISSLNGRPMDVVHFGMLRPTVKLVEMPAEQPSEQLVEV